jgi:hypothetical protein
MTSTNIRRKALATLVILAGCGNYSNDDLDFQLAVPVREELSAKLPQALVDPNAAEYYRATRDVGTIFNELVVKLTGLVDYIRSFTPSSRNGDERIWGPYPVKDDPSWEVRLRMARAYDLSDPGFRYLIEFHRAGAAGDPWKPLMTGTFGLGRVQGELVLDLDPARQSGYPVKQFDKLQKLVLRYQRRMTPMTVEMTIENLPEPPNPALPMATPLTTGATYRYQDEADGSGGLVFVVRGADIRAQALEIRSRWSETGAGRADARIIEGFLATGLPLGIDCWGPDGRATYLMRLLGMGMRREEGSVATCVFGPP